MKKISLIMLLISAVLIGICQPVSAQFPIKIPKINKPKVEQPQTAPPNTNEKPSAPNNAKQNENRSASTEYLTDPEFPKTPQFLLETLEIKAHNEQRYWKAPTQNDYSCWFPQVAFEIMYAPGAPNLRWTADWTLPDGSPWFSEPLELNRGSGDFPRMRSPYEDKDLDERAVVAVGTYGLKITDSKTNQVVFQGKFKVVKMSLDAKLKTKNLFYVENDWNLPIGYVGFMKNWTDYNVHTRPMAFFWFKGTPDTNQFEGEIYFNNQRVATTDKGGNINKQAERGEDCYLARDTCAQSLISFEWENFVVDNSPSARPGNPNGYFTNDHAGEYTIKIFYNGDQVREAKFTVDGKGRIARNTFSDQIFLKDYRVIVPVKVMGTTEKRNQSSWKTDAFYGNLLKGFVAP